VKRYLNGLLMDLMFNNSLDITCFHYSQQLEIQTSNDVTTVSKVY